MALNSGLRSCASKILASTESFLPRLANRGFHSTGVKSTGGGRACDEPYYLHAKHMYDLDRMKYRPLKISLATFTAFMIGVGVPIWATDYQQKKMASA